MNDAHADEDDNQDLIDGAEVGTISYKSVKFSNSLEELCFQMASTTYNPQLAYMLMSLASGAYYKQCAIKNFDALGFR